MRLIDANELGVELKISPNGYLYVTDNDIINAPTIDAVPVVRCHDCVFCSTGKYYGICHKTGAAVDLNGFCAWGIMPKEETE